MDYKQIIVNWKEFQIPNHLPRQIDADLNIDFIITITGPRRSGKTYFCFQLIQKLLKEGIPKENIFYINFEDNRLLGADSEDLEKIFEYFLELSETNKKHRLYLFLDEIQAVKDWDSWVRKIYDTRKDTQLILTGSSSKLLSKEISTKLRGRVINKEIMPLSFKEILSWSGVTYNTKTVSYSKGRIDIKRLFTKYLSDGGYPATFVNKSIPKEVILQGYYDSMMLKDIVERHNIEDVKKLKSLAQLLFQSVSSEMSYTKLANKLMSAGFKISKNTIIEHISHFEDAYLFFQNMKYEYSMAKQIGSIKKVYCIDNGILNSVSFKFSEDTGKLLENAVFIELKREGEQVYYHRKKYECDFIITRKNRVSEAIQVAAKLDEENEEKEIKGLLEALEAYALDEGLILTEDQEETRTISRKKIRIMPVWKWMLD